MHRSVSAQRPQPESSPYSIRLRQQLRVACEEGREIGRGHADAGSGLGYAAFVSGEEVQEDGRARQVARISSSHRQPSFAINAGPDCPGERSFRGRPAQCQRQRFLQAFEGAREVLRLRAALRGGDDGGGGPVPKPHRGFGLVALLAAWAGGPIRVDVALGQKGRAVQETRVHAAIVDAGVIIPLDQSMVRLGFAAPLLALPLTFAGG